jgi:hypothetical protein
MRFVKVGNQYINIDAITNVTEEDKELVVHYKSSNGEAKIEHCQARDPEYQKLIAILNN